MILPRLRGRCRRLTPTEGVKPSLGVSPIHLPTMKGCKNRVENGGQVGRDIPIPEAQDTIAVGSEVLVPPRVVRFLLDVLTSIQLDDERGLEADEVADIGTEGT